MLRKRIDVSTRPPASSPQLRRSRRHPARQLQAYDPGYIDLEQRTLQTIDSPFATRLSPMS
ncbi:MAG: hypothetical protein GC201_16815 [Alphaproteobacteria bacterium]|nr:hypothetical protein [Alphaproteobacteria bacterium]